MSVAQPLSIKLEEGERLRKLGIDSEVCEDIDAALQIRQGHNKLRAVLFQVIDDGDPLTKKAGEIRGLPWAIDNPFEPVADEARGRFIEAVIQKLR